MIAVVIMIIELLLMLSFSELWIEEDQNMPY